MLLDSQLLVLLYYSECVEHKFGYVYEMSFKNNVSFSKIFAYLILIVIFT